MGRYWKSTPIWGPLLHSWDYSIWVDQSTSQQSSCKSFQDWQDLRVDCQKVLLAYVVLRY